MLYGFRKRTKESLDYAIARDKLIRRGLLPRTQSLKQTMLTGNSLSR